LEFSFYINNYIKYTIYKLDSFKKDTMPKYEKYPEGEPDVFCPIGYSIDNIIGKKWSLYILRELALKPKFFNEILKALNWGLTPKMLSLRLKELEKEKIIRKKMFTEKRPVKVKYFLTKRGRELIEAFKGIEKWSRKWNIKVT